MNSSTPPTPFAIAAFYRFAPVADPASLHATILGACRRHDLRGTVLVAREGINGTVAGQREGLEGLFAALGAVAGFAGIEPRWSQASDMPFHRMKVRLKREIVTMGVEDLDPAMAGRRVAPEEWNRLVADPETVVIDTRNDYEVAIGSFAGAVDPGTARFRDFPRWALANREALAGRRVAMFCTGGIRCEKATAYMRAIGVEDVVHLDGGILAYLEATPPEASRWRGECFVFDERVSVGHGLATGEASLCRACRRPLTPEDRESPLFVEGVSCAHCHEARSPGDRARYAERHRQVLLAETRGAPRHIGR